MEQLVFEDPPVRIPFCNIELTPREENANEVVAGSDGEELPEPGNEGSAN